VTRDRKAVEVEWGGLNFEVVDTGGWLEAGDTLEARSPSRPRRPLATADWCYWSWTSRPDWSTRTRTAARLGAAQVAARYCWFVNKVDDAQHEAKQLGVPQSRRGRPRTP